MLITERMSWVPLHLSLWIQKPWWRPIFLGPNGWIDHGRTIRKRKLSSRHSATVSRRIPSLLSLDRKEINSALYKLLSFCVSVSWIPVNTVDISIDVRCSCLYLPVSLKKWELPWEATVLLSMTVSFTVHTLTPVIEFQAHCNVYHIMGQTTAPVHLCMCTFIYSSL